MGSEMCIRDRIYGLGTHAILSHYYLTQFMGLNVRGYCIMSEYNTLERLSDLPVFDYDEIIYNAESQSCRVVIGVGYQRMNRLRTELYHQLCNAGISVQNVIGLDEKHLGHGSMGNGLFIDHGSMLHPFVDIGNNVVIVTSDIGHHSVITVSYTHLTLPTIYSV